MLGNWAGVKYYLSNRLRANKMMPWVLIEFIWRRNHYGDIWRGVMRCLREVAYSPQSQNRAYLTEYVISDEDDDENIVSPN